MLFTEAGARRLSEVEAGLAEGMSSEQVGSRLRRDGVEPDSVAALLTQAGLRARATGKFGSLATEMLFTPAGLEQASRAPVAARHAARFRDAGCARVADLGTGLGTESLALIAAGLAVRPVEIDPFTARFAEYNLAAAARRAGVLPPRIEVADAAEAGLGDADGAFLDPARRTAGSRDTRRLASADDYAPSLDFAFGTGERVPTGVKLGPGFDRDLIPAGAEAQWVSVDGDVVENGIWFGAVSRPGVGRSALILRGDRADELTARGDTADPEVMTAPAEYLYEPDGAVIRARLIGLLAKRLDARTLSDGIAYLSAERLVPTPFAQAFRVIEELPTREKDLRRALAARDVGRLEIKKRGADVDPAALRRRLKLRGGAGATIVLTRAGGRHVALLVERVPAVRQTAQE